LEVEEEPEDEIEEVLDDEEPEDEIEEIEDEDLEELEVEEEPEDEIEEVLDDEEPEDEIEDIEDDEDLEELEVEEEPEDEIEEVLDDEEPEGEIEDIEDDEDLEEPEVEEPEDEIEEVLDDEEPEGEIEEIEDDEDLEEIEMEYTLRDLLDEYGEEGYQGEDGIRKAKFLADEFDQALSSMDKYYNKYILIPKGRYIVGRKQSERNEPIIKKVKLKEFYFGKFPVTNNLFEIFVEKTGYMTTAERTGYGTVYTGRCQRVVDQKTGLETLNWNSSLIGEKVDGACWYHPNGPGSDLYGKRNHPVVQVSLEDALSFAVWTGKRIPSEHEWEAATRTSKGYEYPWGKKYKENRCNIESSLVGDTTPVDKYKRNINSYGIVDAIGNILEWTRDKTEISIDESSELFEYIIKGGSWISGENIRLSDRLSVEPGHTSNILGFRCVAY
jgi:formylglycine-generating enzyme required for sulfatase activity